MDFDSLKERIAAKVVEAMDFSREIPENEVYSLIDDIITDMPERRELDFNDRIRLRREIYNSLRKLDVIQEFLEDPSITEVMINGRSAIFYERNGKVTKSEKVFKSDEKLSDIVQQIVAGCNRAVNEASPIADARLPSGERVNIVLPPVALNGPIITIRRFSEQPITMDRLTEINSISTSAAALLKNLVIAGYNIFISGGTGSGKTTFLNALSQYIPEQERIITIEDSAELKLLNASNLVRLETRAPNSEESKAITIRDLIRASLRMRPDRVIVGECRGEEALDMLQAMNTGHDGSLSTGHGNSPKDMVARLETMVLMGAEIPIPAIRGQIAGGIDIFVHLSRIRGGKRCVSEISEVTGVEGGEVRLNCLYRLEDGELRREGKLINTEKLYRYFGKERAEEITDEL